MHGVFVGLVAFRRLHTKTNLSRRQLEKAVHLLWEVISRWGVCKQQGTPLLWEKRQELPPSLVFPPAWAAHHKHNDFQSLVAQQKLTPSLPSAFQSVRFFLPCSFLSWETKLVILIRRRHDGKKKIYFLLRVKEWIALNWNWTICCLHTPFFQHCIWIPGRGNLLSGVHHCLRHLGGFHMLQISLPCKRHHWVLTLIPC